MLETIEQLESNDPTVLTRRQNVLKWTIAGAASLLLVAAFYLISIV